MINKDMKLTLSNENDAIVMFRCVLYQKLIKINKIVKLVYYFILFLIFRLFLLVLIHYISFR